MAHVKEPLDETVFRDEYLLNFYQGVSTNTVHLYFYGSTFFDHLSNNNVLFAQASRFPEQQYLLETRKAFEDAVKAVPSGGIQFLVTGEPESDDGAWVIQKQLRTVQRGLPDEIEVLGTYYIINGFVFMAPSVGDVLATKTLNITTLLSSFFTIASSLSLFTPAAGHTYFHPSLKPAPTKPTLPGGFSRATTPGREPASQNQNNDNASVAGTTAAAAPNSSAATIGGQFTDPLFLSSLQLSSRWATEYADENPLQGEPGAFVYTNTTEHVAAKNALSAAKAQNAVPDAIGLGKERERERESAVSTAAPTPKPALGEGNGPSRKGSKGGMDSGKLKRRKSKGLASPVTPKEGPANGALK